MWWGVSSGGTLKLRKDGASAVVGAHASNTEAHQKREADHATTLRGGWVPLCLCHLQRPSARASCLGLPCPCTYPSPHPLPPQEQPKPRPQKAAIEKRLQAEGHGHDGTQRRPALVAADARGPAAAARSPGRGGSGAGGQGTCSCVGERESAGRGAVHAFIHPCPPFHEKQIEKKKAELERNEARLKSLQIVRYVGGCVSRVQESARPLPHSLTPRRLSHTHNPTPQAGLYGRVRQAGGQTWRPVRGVRAAVPERGLPGARIGPAAPGRASQAGPRGPATAAHAAAGAGGGGTQAGGWGWPWGRGQRRTRGKRQGTEREMGSVCSHKSQSLCLPCYDRTMAIGRPLRVAAATSPLPLRPPPTPARAPPAGTTPSFLCGLPWSCRLTISCPLQTRPTLRPHQPPHPPPLAPSHLHALPLGSRKASTTSTILDMGTKGGSSPSSSSLGGDEEEDEVDGDESSLLPAEEGEEEDDDSREGAEAAANGHAVEDDDF